MVQWPNACKAPSTDEVLRTLWLHSLMARRSVFHILSGSDPDLLGLGSASPWTLHACLDHPSHLFGPPQCAPWSSPFLSLQDSVLCELVSWSELSPESLRHALTRYGGAKREQQNEVGTSAVCDLRGRGAHVSENPRHACCEPLQGN